MKVMTSCSLRPASRAKKPPMAWMPSCEFPAIRMTASEIFETCGLPPDVGAVIVDSLMKFDSLKFVRSPAPALQFGEGAKPISVSH